MWPENPCVCHSQIPGKSERKNSLKFLESRQGNICWEVQRPDLHLKCSRYAGLVNLIRHLPSAKEKELPQFADFVKNCQKVPRLVIFFFFPYRSHSPQPHPDPTQRARNGPETDPKWTEIKRSGVGQPGGGLPGWGGGVGVVREKENH